VAVTMTMLITTILFYFVAKHLWHWHPVKALLLYGVFAIIESAFLSANLLKFFPGGWFPLAIGAVIFILMTTWATGRKLVKARMGAPAGGTGLGLAISRGLLIPIRLQGRQYGCR
jgi:KUP system potassium uptake protein